MPTNTPVTNQSFLDLTLCNQQSSVASNTVQTDILDITMNKIVNCDVAVVGGRVCYTVTIVNNSQENLENVVFRDPLGSNVQYIEGTFTIDGQPYSPSISADNVLTNNITIAPGESVTVEFCVEVLQQDPIPTVVPTTSTRRR